MLDSDGTRLPGQTRVRWVLAALVGGFATALLIGPLSGAADASLTCSRHWKATVVAGNLASPGNYVEAAALRGTDVVCLEDEATAPVITVSASRTVGGLLLAGGALVVNPGVTLSVHPVVAGDVSSISNLQLSGRLAGSGPVSLTGSSGAFLDGAAVTGGVKTVASGATYVVNGTLSIGTPGGLDANRGQLVNQGRLTWPGTGDIELGGGRDGSTAGSRLTNAGAFQVTAVGGNRIHDNRGGGSGTPVPRFTNAAGGTMSVSGSPGGLAYVWAPFDNGGAVEVTGGSSGYGNAVSLEVVVGNGTGGVDSGRYSAGANNVVKFYEHSRRLSATASVTGAAGITWQGGTLTTAGTPSVSRLNLVAGTVTGSQSITALEWSGGTLDGTGTTTIPAGGTAALHGTVTIDHGHVLKNLGTMTRPNDGWTYVNNAARLLNGGLLAITGDGGQEISDASHAGGSFRNLAGAITTFTASTYTGTFHLRLPVDNLGTLRVAKGTLVDDGGSSDGTSDTGTLDIAPSATFQGVRVRRFGAAARVTGDGTLLINGGAQFAGQAVARMSFTGGTITGSQSVGVLWWGNGVFDGPGTTTIAPGGTVSMQGDLLLDHGRVFHNAGTVYRPNNGWLHVSNGARVDNAGTFSIYGDGGYAIDDPSANGGTFRTLAGGVTVFTAARGSGTFFLQVPVTTVGTLLVNKGILGDELDTGLIGGVLTGGTYIVGNGPSPAALRLPGAISTNSSTLVLGVQGSFVDPATGTVNSALRTVATNHGSLTVNRSLTMSGPLTSDGAVRLGYSPSTLRTASYTQSGQGSLVLAPGTTLIATGSGRPVLINGGTVSGPGTITGKVTNAGVVTPGTVPDYGTPLVVNGSSAGRYTQTSGGTLAVTVRGTATPGTDFSQLAPTGDVSLAGALVITTDPSWTPVAGDSVTVVSTAGAVTGAFATISGAAISPTLVWRVVYGPGTVQLVATPA